MPTDTEKAKDLQEIGAASYGALVEMVNALECDYERLAELREERAAAVEEYGVPVQWDAENGEELEALELMAGECESREDAEQRIQEAPLSLEVRSGWYTPGSEDREAEEFNILLSTGGPAVRIMGELSQGEPSRAWLEVQDWFTPWTQYFGANQDILLTYARCFYFGEG